MLSTALYPITDGLFYEMFYPVNLTPEKSPDYM